MVPPEVGSDVLSGVVIDPTGVKVGDSRSNRSQDIRLPQKRHEQRRQSSHKGK